MSQFSYSKVTIIGPGLVGGSIGMALLTRKLAREVVGVGRQTTSLVAAAKAGAVTTTTTDLASGVAGADLVVVCTPVDSIVDCVKSVAKSIDSSQQTLITDVGSTKSKIVAELEHAQQTSEWPKNARFIGSHPIAGNERRGAEHGFADLFVDRMVVVTPAEKSTVEDIARLKQFWSNFGARVTTMTADEHDAAMASISHLPHLLASAIAASTPDRYVSFSGTGWQDTTRIAAGDPALWRQILLANRANVLAGMNEFARLLSEFRSALDAEDAVRLEQLLGKAKQIRDMIGGS